MKTVVLSFFALVITFIAKAQDDAKKIDVNINTQGSNWYASPWIWVVGAAVFILLLVALTRGSGRREG